jgi:hypothetical protein
MSSLGKRLVMGGGDERGDRVDAPLAQRIELASVASQSLYLPGLDQGAQVLFEDLLVVEGSDGLVQLRDRARPLGERMRQRGRPAARHRHHGLRVGAVAPGTVWTSGQPAPQHPRDEGKALVGDAVVAVETQERVEP